MFTTTPYLRIRRPSPSAAEFTVSTLPPLTVPLRLTLVALDAARAVLGAGVLLFLYAVWAQSPYGTFPSNPNHNPNHNNHNNHSNNNDKLGSAAHILLLHALLTSPPGVLAADLARRADPRAAAAACLAALYALTRRLHTEESLLVLRGLGIQTRSSSVLSLSLSLSLSSSLSSSSSTRFIPTGKIRDVLVNEAFCGFGVRHCLVVVVDGEPDLVVVFPRLLPPARVVERVWRGVRECLYERDSGCGGGGGGGGGGWDAGIGEGGSGGGGGEGEDTGLDSAS
ncbi:putative phosphatidylinositol N-acetylglucosaminyltransferase [Rosellinia necatrix]|uniref:Putative phosphatidylinositol N-acetylglucosaminyltransferase n=1 Tax=Rosellinia necatrix TaxID=77044 RepID=A0A1W2TK39_ROSNE|nr:putative phosphatidylinositol N-acetylglucosaminyltransferase [Rosellinia necatrix]